MQEDRNVKKKGFLKGMRSELKKVIWPTGKQTVKSTFITITFVLMISIALIVLNLIFGELNKLWINSLSNDSNTIINSVVSGDASGEVTEDEHDHEHVEDISGDIDTNEIVSGE